MNGQEIATAMRHRADFLVLVIDNGSYGTIRNAPGAGLSHAGSGDRPRTTPISPPFARAYGAWAETVSVRRTSHRAGAGASQRGVKLLT
jgi:acetolactate synthase-1/2/3 large subunit